jgi:hypothetical protein
MAYVPQQPVGAGPNYAQAVGGLGIMGMAAATAAPAPALAAPAAGMAALGPVGWAALAVTVGSTLFGMSAARKQAAYERYQLKLAENQARIDAANTIVDLSREIRYQQGTALAALGHSAAGVGESFLAIRADELNLYRRDVSNAYLSSLAGRSSIQAASSLSRSRQSSSNVLGYLTIASQGLDGYKKWTRLKPGGSD